MSQATQEEGQLQDYSVDQAAGAIVLVLGAVAGLLQVIWMSKCHCKVNLCYIFRCERRPPTEEEMKTLKAKVNQEKDKKELKKQQSKENKDSPKPTTSSPEPEPEPEIDNLV
tara:strand:- start:1245 stop:1580 length:336 start_codon:yes stop_codon:yes gene_type:complete